MVKFLENQCGDLGNLLEKERVKTANCTLEIAELKNLIAKMNIVNYFYKNTINLT